MSFRGSLKFFLLFLCFLVVPVAAFSQQTGAAVHGVIADPDDAVIPGATITFTPPSGKAVLGTSQNDGTYTLRGVPPGTYSVTVTMSGFATFVKQGVRIAPGQNLTLDAKLAIQEQSQEVQVNAQSVQLSTDPDSNASATVIKGKDLDALSDDPDELSSELSALAGPAAGPNGGQIYVDGFTGGQLPPKSSIREIRVNQNPFSAQYDKLGYGRVEVFTKPGTDKLHGNISVQGGDSSFNTSNPFLGKANTQPPYHTLFVLGSVSGPINRFSSFTVGGSHRTIQDNNIINPSSFYSTSATSTDLCLPLQAGCSAFASYPVTARAISHPQTRSDISPRIDLALGEKNTLTIRYQYNVNGVQNSGIGNTSLPSVGYNSDSTENEIQISDTQLVRSNIVNETRFEYGRQHSTQNPLSTAPTLSVQGIFSGGGSSQGTSSTRQNNLELQNYTSIQLSKHFIRFGGRLRSTGEELTSTSGSNGTFTYAYLLDPCTDPSVTAKPSACRTATNPCDQANAGVSSYQCGIASQFNRTTINQPRITGRLTDVGLYVEDDWKPKTNLTISVGTRLEAQNVISSAHDFAPRVSFAYGVPRKSGQSTTVIRGGVGVFYDRFTLGDTLTTYRLNGVNQISRIIKNPGGTCQPTAITSCTGTPGNVSRPTTYSLGSILRSSYTVQEAIGFDQQLGRLASVSVNYLNAHGFHQYLSRDFVGTSAINYQFQSGGVYRENQLLINSNVRLRKVTLFGFYSLNLAHANTSGSGFFPTNSVDPRADYGRASFTHSNFGVIGGNWLLPYAFSVSPFLLAQSGTPYNITSGQDTNGDTIFNDRPYFANGTSGSCFRSSDFAANQNDAKSLSPVPINYCTGPANFTLNMRLAKTFGFGERTGGPAGGNQQGGNRRGGGPGGPGGGHGGPGGGGPMGFGGASSGRRYSLTLGAQAFNLFNTVPYGTPTSVLSSPRFGQFTTLATGPFSSATAVRRITLQASFNF